MSNIYGELASKAVGEGLKAGRGCMIWFLLLLLAFLALLGTTLWLSFKN